ncbi:MAG: hypothetical protein KIT72_11120 [Polyangiaceae bacterium]|nr:hypothetical protein [Polyangiaceae bacterium]MCW5790962.1 hypothetical protein [Polyangiaceae bacterium]
MGYGSLSKASGSPGLRFWPLTVLLFASETALAEPRGGGAAFEADLDSDTALLAPGDPREERARRARHTQSASIDSKAALSEPIELRAEEAELDLTGEALELRGDVELRQGRFWLNAERLRVARRAGRLLVRGPGELKACAAARPPVTFGFEAAEVSAEGDVRLTRPAVKLGGVTVLGLPSLALKSPDSSGWLPPTLAYRGGDGLYAGLGYELGLARGGGERPPSRLRLAAGAYSPLGQGEGAVSGARAAVDYSSPSGRSALRYESLDGGMLDLDLVHASSGDVPLAPDRAAGRHRVLLVDALRGARALRAPLGDGALRRVSLPEDRARLMAAQGSGELFGYVQGRADGARGAPHVETVRPGALVGAWRSLAVLGGLDVWVSSQGLALAEQSVGRTEAAGSAPGEGLWLQRAGADLGAPLGPVTSSGWLAASWLERTHDHPGERARRAVWADGAARASVPLQRRFASGGREAARHVIEPGVAAAAQVMDSEVDGQLKGLFEQRLTAPGRAQPLSAELGLAAGGWLGRRRSFAEGELAVQSLPVGGQLRALYHVPWGEQVAQGSWVWFGRLRIGRRAGQHLRLWVESQSTPEWRLAEPGAGALAAHAEVSEWLWSSPLVGHGTTGAAAWVLPLSPVWALSAGASVDLNASRAASSSVSLTSGSAPEQEPRDLALLAASLGAGYRHPCGCLGLAGELSHRAGRHPAFHEGAWWRGFDAELRVELLP